MKVLIGSSLRLNTVPKKAIVRSHSARTGPNRTDFTVCDCCFPNDVGKTTLQVKTKPMVMQIARAGCPDCGFQESTLLALWPNVLKVTLAGSKRAGLMT